eukprot:g535.t1
MTIALWMLGCAACTAAGLARQSKKNRKSKSAQKSATAGDAEIDIAPSSKESGERAAEYVARVVRQVVAEKGSARIIFATGASQFDFIEALLRIDGMPWNRCTCFHLDEYVGLSEEHPASFRKYLKDRLFSKMNPRPGRIFYLDPANIKAYAEALRRKPIDLVCLGIGENGHLAFNDPPAKFDDVEDVKIVTLDERCRMQQVGEGWFPSLAQSPSEAASLTVPCIMRCERISCVVPDTRKAEAVKAALTGPIDLEVGFVDLQVNGHGGVDFSSQGLTAAAVRKACDGVLSSGCCAFLPTVITSDMDTYETVLPLLAAEVESRPQQVLGIHLEGPFISSAPGAVGCHKPELCRKPDVKLLQRLQKLARGKVRLITIAAELRGAEELAKAAHGLGMRVSLGHQMAQDSDVRRLCQPQPEGAGATLLTHLGNGLPNMIHRHQNIFWTALDLDHVTAMLITDGHHLPAACVSVCQQGW